MALLIKQYAAQIVLSAILIFNILSVYQNPIRFSHGVRHSIPINVMSFNLLLSNNNVSGVIEFINGHNLDLVFLFEVTEQWVKPLEELRDVFPHQMIIPKPGAFGLAVLSRIPLENTQVVYDRVFPMPFVFSQIKLGDKTLHLAAAHFYPPLSAATIKSQNFMFKNITEKINKLGGDWLMCGDFNSTPWSRRFKDFILDTGLNLPEYLPMPTWPMKLAYAGIPIDHCLSTNNLRLDQQRIKTDLGSDHRPLLLNGFYVLD